MIGPVAGRGRLFRRDPLAGHVGDVAPRRRGQRYARADRLECAGSVFQHVRVKRMGNMQAPALDAACLQRRAQALDTLRIAGDHAKRGRIDGRQRQAGRQQWLQRLLVHRHGEHGARCLLLDELAAHADQTRRIRQRQHAGKAGRDIFTDAVPDHRRGLDTPGHPEPGQCVFDGEQGRLRIARLVEPCGGGLGVLCARSRVEQCQQVDVQVRAHQFCDAYQRVAEGLLTFE